MRSKRLLRDRRRGLRVVGPGFYLWDSDAREALRLAAELSRRTPTPVRARAPLPMRSPRP